MDGQTRIDRDLFYRMLHKTVASPGQIPFSTLPWTPHIHLAIFVHRVDGLAPGLYMLVRDRTQRSGWRRPVLAPRRGCAPPAALKTSICGVSISPT